MTRFSYKARSNAGGRQTGVIEAADSRTVAFQLGKLGYTPLSIVASESNNVGAQIEKFFSGLQKVKLDEIIVFARQLSSILEAGVPLLEGLDAVAEQLHNKKFRDILLMVRKDIEHGSSFSDALSKHKEVFSALVINMVRAGEKAGILNEELDRVANLLEKDLETTEKIKTATRYPLVVVFSLAVAFTILMVFVIPQFVKFFGAFKAQLPLPTRLLIGANFVIQNYWYLILGTAAAAGYGFNRLLATEKGRYGWDQLVLKTPVFGPLFLKIFLSRFARMLAAMLRSGIPILEALMITASSVNNKVISQAIVEMRDKVSQGKSLTEPMKTNKVFPPIAVAMVSIGERAGSLEKMLNKVSDYFDREADYTIKNLTPLIEPMLIFGLGFIVLLFALGIFLPMWSLMDVYKNY